MSLNLMISLFCEFRVCGNLWRAFKGNKMFSAGEPVVVRPLLNVLYVCLVIGPNFSSELMLCTIAYNVVFSWDVAYEVH